VESDVELQLALGCTCGWFYWSVNNTRQQGVYLIQSQSGWNRAGRTQSARPWKCHPQATGLPELSHPTTFSTSHQDHSIIGGAENAGVEKAGAITDGKP